MPGIYVATCQAGGLALSRMGRWQNSQNAYFLENYFENDWMTRNVVISEADTLMYVIIKAENVSYRELVGTTLCTTLQPSKLHKLKMI